MGKKKKIRLNGHQMLDALRLIGINITLEDLPEELDTVLVFGNMPAGMLDEDGSETPPGVYVHYEDIPEEGWFGPLGDVLEV